MRDILIVIVLVMAASAILLFVLALLHAGKDDEDEWVPYHQLLNMDGHEGGDDDAAGED